MVSETITSRTSISSLAVIRQTGSDGLPRYLAQWNPKWQAFNWVGGHKNDDESYRACLVREIAEELGVFPHPDDPDAVAAMAPAGRNEVPRCRVDFRPLGVLEYEAFSRSANATTKYAIALFGVDLPPASIDHVSRDANNCWLTEQEIDAGICAGGRAVSETMRRHLDWLRGLDRPPVPQ
jgi:NUDIX domain